MTDACGGGEDAAAPGSSLDPSDPELHYEEEEEEEESEPSDSSSVFSEDSVYPSHQLAPGAGGTGELSLYQCCTRNDARLVRERLEHGVTRAEATEMDSNGRNGLLLACSRGFLDLVPLLQSCPHLDVNQQDKDGNTALMLAAQAGHVTIVNYLLNYYPGLEVDKRDPRGLTALMKAAVQGQQDCVAALLLAGADLQAVDPIRGKTARDWAAFTGRFQTGSRIRSLLSRPRAEQFGSGYRPEWPALPGLVARALSPKSPGKRLAEKLSSLFTFSFPRDPEEDGVLDHMVRMTTSLASPFVATACQTLCPDSPPELGKRRLSVPEILGGHLGEPAPAPEPTPAVPGTLGEPAPAPEPTPAVPHIPPLPPRRAAGGLLSFLPLWLWRGNSICPAEPVPKIKVSRTCCCSSPRPRERRQRRGDQHLLQLPKWRYKELKEQKRAAEEEEEGKGQAEKKRGRKKRR